MSHTKEQILMTALRLFAREGYEAVSVSTIAGELGITKGALYKHYKSKRDIFDHIVARMFQLDAQQAQSHTLPEQTYQEAPSQYAHCDFPHIKAFTLAQFAFWTEDPFASDFRKMLSLERYGNPEMGKLYDDCICAGPVAYMEDIFREMIEAGALAKADPKQLALAYYGPMYLLIQMYDSAKEPSALAQMLEAHIDRFINANTL